MKQVDNIERIKIISANITKFRKELGITQKELAERLDIKPSTLSDYINLRSAPSFGVIQKLADVFRVKKSDIDTTFKESLQAPDDLVQAINDKVVQLTPPRKQNVLGYATEQLEEQKHETTVSEPLVEYHVYERLSAGTGEAVYEDYNYDTVYFEEEINHDIASWVWGDSMEPTYLNGEVALIKETGFDYDGAVYAVVWDGQTYIKRVYREEDGLRLVSLNKKYGDKFAPYDEDPRIVGLVVGHFMPMEN
ncbi:XRE family transcriptional regulator [Streptococcus moroccensis]|uniref:Phage repressor protein C with HTH and peptisase S24 domain n=1 Tax=Streptococcus moroccensis TaxID=1451356 RepID=A0ABT9YNY0_9STRE|nr:XRE family transcriptional regulator [Streptococcus moroccensis]MDQ0221695.1 phage repressor protein C with HTH and peptisase S24 domain [Streptococcus moroccensis]